MSSPFDHTDHTDHGPVTDVHQHVWPGPLLQALRARRRAPRLRDGWTLQLDGEPDCAVDPADHDPYARAQLATGVDGLQRALVSLSAPLGIESLPADEAAELIDAWHEGAFALPAPFAPWAAVRLSGEPDPDHLRRLLDRGCVGLQLPATALRDGPGYAHVAPLLDVLQAVGKPLFIHPGPATPIRAPTEPWWPAVVDYVGQMHAAWFAFLAHGRPAHPTLTVLFAMLAGLAPLHGERVQARAGAGLDADPRMFLETSSYGPQAITAVAGVTGIEQIVHGSDRPYAPPAQLDPSTAIGIRVAGPARLFTAR